MAIARLNGEVIAESSHTVVLSGQHYFPARSVRAEFFRPTGTRDDKHFYSVIVRGTPTPDCASRFVAGASIPDPRIADHMQFFGPVQVED